MGSLVDNNEELWHSTLQKRKEESVKQGNSSSRGDGMGARRRRPRSRFGNNDYIPPFRRKQASGARDYDVRQQQDLWFEMKKKINGVINRINASNIRDCVVHLLLLNLIRAKGVFCKALMRAQLASSHFSDVYAALISVVNTRMPEVGELLVCRLIWQLKDGYARREKAICIASLRFLAHLFNQQVINELSLLEFTSTCLIDPSNGSTELAVLVIQECGHFMSEKSPQATEMVFSRLREVLHNNAIDYRTQVLVDDVMELRRKKFGTAATLRDELDLVDEDDIIPHFFSLEDVEISDVKDELNSFSFDRHFEENESKYGAIRDVLLGDEAKQVEKQAVEDKQVNEEEEKDDKHETTTLTEGAKVQPTPSQTEDLTESKLVDFRRIVYLKIMSSASYEEVAHKLTKFMIDNRGMEAELCNMVIECCSQEKTFLRFYGLLGQRLCFLSREYSNGFQEKFETIYATVHRYDNRKIRNIATFFSYLLAANALSWGLMRVVYLIEEETTASRRIFLKILFQEVAKTLGSAKLMEIFKDEETSKHLATVLPRDVPKNTRFAINFFTVIGLGYLTEDLREHLKQIPKTSSKELAAKKDDESDDSSSLSSSSLSSSSLSSSSGISDRDDSPPRRIEEGEDRDGKSRHSSDSVRMKSPGRERRLELDRDGHRSQSPRISRRDEDSGQKERHSPRHRSRGPYRNDGSESAGHRSPKRISSSRSPRSFSSSDSRERSKSPERERYSRRRYRRRESSSPEARRRRSSRDRERRSGSYTRRHRSTSSSSSEPPRRYRRSRSSSESSRARKKRRISPHPDGRVQRKERRSGSRSRRRRSSYSSDSSYSRGRGRDSSPGRYRR